MNVHGLQCDACGADLGDMHQVRKARIISIIGLTGKVQVAVGENRNIYSRLDFCNEDCLIAFLERHATRGKWAK